ncbi:uncharacterized protein K460DRAFT_361975 [Cucurbitaria berberidis CBS 394.84]|uniref:Uncharacterized protein n=1 Tax=Cucurbitaria berberidis CBS 394.84 TaxID=1168544 RepID=A0A9P4LDN8_9PLEO|nr:uncharacterized protein K460DRAFT_361975 [Cucurbitaria berberidis CBS 394.84]KAF1851210.1 hypothetical protein K460DRAFT_361975 [Cucurbitaria berberidis CBS 394.84]
MAPKLGKRKRVTRAELEQASRSSSPSSGSNDSGAEDLQAIFRRAFEAKFKPLPVETKKPKIEQVQVEDEDEGEESDWSGISEDEQDQVEVIEYKDSRHERDETEKAEMKAFMSSKPPTSSATTAPPKSLTANKKQGDDADPTDSTNLKNDLALQKLLRESHLLSASSSGASTPTLTATGIARHKSTDLHLQSLGAKASVFAQKKMPMAQRKHEIQKARLIEEKRRAHAKAAGIVLERENKVVKKDVDRKRERGVGGPSIGRFRGGTLSLSKQDVHSITGGSKGKGKGVGKKGKR